MTELLYMRKAYCEDPGYGYKSDLIGWRSGRIHNDDVV